MPVNLRTRWIDVLNRVAVGTKRTRSLMTPVGVLVFGVFTGAFVGSAVAVDFLFGLSPLLPQPWGLPVGGVVLAIGAMLVAWSAGHFVKAKGTPVPFNPPPRIVDTGPYRHVRNPMLSGVFLILFGSGLALGSLSLVLFFTPLYIAVNVWELKRIEEPELAMRLGAEYVEYRSRTPMFVPGAMAARRVFGRIVRRP